MKRVNFLAFCLLALTGVDSYANPYLGIDAQWRALSFKGINANLLSHSAPAINVYAGFPFNDNFALEFGAHAIHTKKAKALVKVRGLHASIVASMPVGERLAVISGFGLASLKYTHEHTAFRIDTSRVVPRVTAGLEYKLIENIGWRTTLIYEHSRTAFNHKDLKLRNHYGISTGLKFNF
jgi:hypothetical protein